MGGHQGPSPGEGWPDLNWKGWWGDIAVMNTFEATITSECGRFKVEIERRPEGSLQVVAYKWTEEADPEYGQLAEFWMPVGQSITITDTLERAERLAREKLQLFMQPV